MAAEGTQYEWAGAALHCPSTGGYGVLATSHSPVTASM